MKTAQITESGGIWRAQIRKDGRLGPKYQDRNIYQLLERVSHEHPGVRIRPTVYAGMVPRSSSHQVHIGRH